MDDKLYNEYMDDGYQTFEYEEWLENQVMELRTLLDAEEIAVESLLDNRQ